MLSSILPQLNFLSALFPPLFPQQSAAKIHLSLQDSLLSGSFWFEMGYELKIFSCPVWQS